MMQIKIDQQYARIGLQIQKPQIQIHSTLPALKLQTEQSQLQIDSRPPKLSIDQTRCFEAVNRRSPAALSDLQSNQALRDVLQGIARVGQEGDQLGAIENHYSIADLAAQNTFERPAEVTISAMPPPSIHFEVYPLQIQYTPGRIQGEAQRGQVKSDFEWGKVQAYVAQQNYIHIKAEPSGYDILT